MELLYTYKRKVSEKEEEKYRKFRVLLTAEEAEEEINRKMKFLECFGMIQLEFRKNKIISWIIEMILIERPFYDLPIIIYRYIMQVLGIFQIGTHRQNWERGSSIWYEIFTIIVNSSYERHRLSPTLGGVIYAIYDRWTNKFFNLLKSNILCNRRKSIFYRLIQSITSKVFNTLNAMRKQFFHL